MENGLVIKQVDFNGTELMAAQEKETGKIYVGVSYIAKGIGLTDGQMRRQKQNMSEDCVIKKGITNLRYPTSGGMQEVIAIEINFLPLWLAKISITPKMISETPEVADRLIEYQIKAKDVLAEAFLKKTTLLPQTLQDALRAYADEIDRSNLLIEENKTLKPKAENYDLFLTTENSKDIGEFAKSIQVSKNNKILGRNKIFDYLRNKGLLMESNIPYQRFITQKLFKVIEVVKGSKSFSKTLVSPKGIDYIINLLREDKFIVVNN